MNQSANPFDRLEPRDGFRVVKHEQGALEISLHVGFFTAGEWRELFDHVGPDATEEIWAHKMPEAVDHGRRARAHLLIEAHCRYFNSGGTWDELDDMQNRLRRAIPSGLSVEGWHYFDGYIDTEGNFTQLWVEDGGERVVRWVEGQFVDTGLTLADIERETDDEEEAENEGHVPAVHSLGDLQDQSGTGAESQAPDPPGCDIQGPSGTGRRLRRLGGRSEEHTSELQSRRNLVCRLLLEKKKHYEI